MKTRIQSDAYRVVNLVFAVFIIAIITYSLIFAPDQQHPVPSGSMLLTGENSVSTGLSRSFSAIVRFDFESAAAFNPYGMRIFLFFLIQLLMRVTGFLLAGHSRRMIIIYADILLSAVLFIVSFRPFFIALSRSLTSGSVL